MKNKKDLQLVLKIFPIENKFTINPLSDTAALMQLTNQSVITVGFKWRRGKQWYGTYTPVSVSKLDEFISELQKLKTKIK